MRARFRKDVLIAGTILFLGSVRSQPSYFQLRKSRKDDSLLRASFPVSSDSKLSDTSSSPLKAELNAGLEAKVTLAVVAARKVIAKAGQLIIRVHEPDAEVLRDRDVNAAANHQGKCIVGRRLASAEAGVFVAGIGVKVAVGTA
jgi:hypothetical protein